MRKDILHRCVVWFLANLRQVSQNFNQHLSTSGLADKVGIPIDKIAFDRRVLGKEVETTKGNRKGSSRRCKQWYPYVLVDIPHFPTRH
jgi:hypothetical protein